MVSGLEVWQRVGAVILAAGLARRMGAMKVLLEWQPGITILEYIIQQLMAGGVEHIIIVTGNEADRVSDIARKMHAQTAYNPSYEFGEMVSSLQAGLSAMPAHVDAALIVLGDQPQIKPAVIRQIVEAYARGEGGIVAPSYQMRRGHPMLVDRKYWDELLRLPYNAAPRDVINAHADDIAYVVVDDDSILRDVDTQQQYQEERRRAGQS